MNKLDTVTFGEAMAMFVADELGELQHVSRFTRRLAGAETNVAIGMARLGLRSGFVSRVGNDAFGQYIKNKLLSEKVNMDCIRTDEVNPTGFQLKSRIDDGDPEVQYFRKRSAASHMGPGNLNRDYFLSSRHLHMTGIPLAISPSTREFALEALRLMKQAGRTISFDPNLRPSLWSSREEMIAVTNAVACEADWVMPGIEEAELLIGTRDVNAISDYYLQRGAKLVVIKLGPEGAYYRSQSEVGIAAGFKVAKVVDTVGAGDGFAVGLISGLLLGKPIVESVIRGNAIGAMAVQTYGDHEGYPEEAALASFLEHNKQGVICS
ncbi:2-dehydro-3-deoxygluconokinase [Gordoniibacillus kamchatkensis]|uniref:2-dehydro-3-deoxygluconokinase n=1 Tax=Gordoniibacillus kamchatkensis TaxID=1590651 RepID=A0ABR5AKU5_9BACL|nr:sugar kinase [Paenibacillus sp. VKM B-2647]KIL41586.1 2-dehydro-3-deoxygluconokinase [Paenibacillus sp. VKM B-2647]